MGPTLKLHQATFGLDRTSRRVSLLTSPLASQNIFKEVQRPRIAGLSEPKHCLFADCGITIRSCDLDEFRNPLPVGKLREREYRTLLHFGIGVIFKRDSNLGCHFGAGLLRHPKQSLATNARGRVLVSHSNQFPNSSIA